MTELDLLNELVESIKTDVINSLQAKGRYATGQTVKALEVAENGSQVQLLAPEYIEILETGRPPTSPNAPKGDPTVFERIQEWCDAKGIDQKAAWAITQNIHKNGYKGKPGVLTEPLSDQNIDKHATDIADQLATLIITQSLKI
jgi:hypothetical protein